MNDMLSKIKNNLSYILIPVIFVSFLLINLNVVYFGDDYYYLTFSNLEFSEFFAKLAEHYIKDNGRFIVHLLATLFLKLPMPFWQVINSLILTGICYFTAKITTQKNKEKMPLILSIMFFFIAFLDITITRQSTYWLTGSFNYIYPILLLFAYCFCLSKIENNNFFIGAIVLGFLSAATMEQSAMMTLGLTILSLIAKIDSIKNIKNILKQNKKLIILSIITLIGVCTVVLAPAQFVRIDLEENNVSTIDKILVNSKFLIQNYTQTANILPYCIIFNLLVFTYALKCKKNVKLISVSCFANILLNLISVFLISNIFTITRIVTSLLIIISYLINFIYINKNLYNKLISPLTISLVLMLGSQIMMLISPVFGPRNLIFGLIMFAFIICQLASKINFNLNEKYNFKLNHVFTCIFLLLALTANIKTAKGYIQTKNIEDINIEIISKNQEIISNEAKEIVLYKFSNDSYGWSMPYISTYHEFWFKHIYNIKCKINWEYHE